jgi:tetratricopeptide (TPR) repeat protein
MLLLVAASSLFAQSRDAMKKMFDEGRFQESKPLFEKLLAKNPKNSEYNYWYAACCLETGDTVDVEEMLEFAASRNIVKAYWYLGYWYSLQQDYSLASENYGFFIDETHDDSLRNVAQQRMNLCDRLNRMVRNSEIVCFVDSFVVDKEDFLSVYTMGSDVGRVASCADYFGDAALPGYLNETQRGMDIFFSDENDDDAPLLKLYRRSKVGDSWGSVQPIMGFDTKGNDDYPFMLADGITLYFASDGEGSIGGYDIFVSRMDTESGRFFRPDNVGMPFNSTANDYMMAINEVANLGWFVSDRNQPEGKVCVYLFIPNVEKKRVDVGSIGYARALEIANISSIAATQTDADAVRRAHQQMAMLLYVRDTDGRDGEFLFVIDDLHDYTSLDEFRSTEARELFSEWQERVKQHGRDIEQLAAHRDEYARSSAAAKQSMRQTILLLENKVEEDVVTLKRMEYEVRRIEQAALYGNDN